MQRASLLDHVLERRTVLPLEALEQREAIRDLLKACWRRIDAVSVTAQERRQLFELGLDAVARREVLRKLRVDRRELVDPLPHTAQTCEDRVVVLVQRCIALFAEALHALRIG